MKTKLELITPEKAAKILRDAPFSSDNSVAEAAAGNCESLNH
jgi:hypothetical protein